VAPYGARVNYKKDMILGDEYMVPKGTPMYIALGVVMKDPAIWENPNEFNSDRFLDPNNRRLKFSPFGFAGGRICPGSKLAIYET